MASAKLYDFNGESKGTIDLPSGIFEGAVNRPVLYDAIRMYLANRRSGTAKTKERGEVSFSTRKPYRQKGTGRARAGRRSSPIWKGGGTVFGPHNRDYRYAIPKKMKRIALKSALIDKGDSESVVIVEGFQMEEPKTKRFSEFLGGVGLGEKKILFITDSFDENVYKSMRNLPGVEFMLSRNINAYEVIRADVLLFTKEALSTLEEVFSS
jgi:large subunit ribosomal protein L4